MPVKSITPKSFSVLLKEVAEKFFPGVEITQATDSTFTYSVETGYHQSNDLFIAEIIVGLKPEDAVMTITKKTAEVKKLISMAEAFCKEKYDCNIEVTWS